MHLPQPQSKHTLIFKAATQQAKKHKTYFFGLWLCKRKLEQIPFCTCQNPNPNALSSSQLLPTNKGCASTPPEAELHKLRVLHSARTVHHSARYSARHSARPQNAVNTMGLAFFDHLPKLGDGWPESVEEQGLLLLVWRHHITKQYIKDVL